MPLFCKQCNGRRFPKWIKEENKTIWLCETCGNFVDSEDNIIRDVEQIFEIIFWEEQGLKNKINRENRSSFKK